MDYYGASFIAFILAIAELYTFCYFYGVNRLCKDIEFMLGFYPNIYWRVCWKFVTPGLMTVIMIYTLANLEPLKDGGHDYPPMAYIIGRCISSLGLLPLPIFAIYAICSQKEKTLWKVTELTVQLYERSKNLYFIYRKQRQLSDQQRNGVR